MKKLNFKLLLSIFIVLSLIGCSNQDKSREQKVLDIAEKKAIEVFGKELIESEKPLKANLKDGIWTVEGCLPPNTVVGVEQLK